MCSLHDEQTNIAGSAHSFRRPEQLGHRHRFGSPIAIAGGGASAGIVDRMRSETAFDSPSPDVTQVAYPSSEKINDPPHCGQYAGRFTAAI
jgi:hypothetical protein